MPEARPLTVVQFLAAYAAGASPRSVLSHCLKALQELGTGPNGDTAFIAIASDAQLEEQLAWLETQPPESLPLRGVPFVVKDNIDVAGWPTTAGLPSRNPLADSTAPVVSRLRQAGAVLLAKTNLDQFATGLVGTRSPFGAVTNPFSAEHISGGSSSGSASAVARGLAAFALGTDTAGSGRVPAGFCNLVGLKPTPGLVSTQGVLPACASLDCVSVFALTAEDASLILPLVASDAQAREREPSFHPVQAERLAFGQPLRLGVVRAPRFDDPDYARAYHEAIEQARSLGFEVIETDLSVLDRVARLLYEGPWLAERDCVVGALIDADAPGLDPTVSAVIRRARGFDARDAFQGLYVLRAAECEARALWQTLDVLMLPTAPSLPTLAEVRADPVHRNAALGRYTNSVNLLGWCALAMPSGFTPRGLPFGVSFIAPGGADVALLDLGRAWQDALRLPIGAHLADYSTSGTGSFPVPERLAGEALVPIAVVGAHLSGMPLHHQVVNAGAKLLARTRTAACYRLYALAHSESAGNATPLRPGLCRVADGAGAEIEVEVYAFPVHAVGAFFAGIAPPLGLGSLQLADGRWVKGFICEPWALAQAEDITGFQSWRYYVRERESRDRSSPD